MRHQPPAAILTIFVCLAAALAGCSQKTLNSAQSDAQRNADTINQKAKQAAQQARPELDRLGLQTRVTTALTAANLPTTIHVRADAQGVYLRGSVHNPQDKARAGQIARDTLGPGKLVHNEIQVHGE